MIYLYIKTHNATGLKYFGKTTKNPMKYRGSGKRWLAHIKVHGYDVSTEVVGSFEDVAAATDFAVRFSTANNIVGDPSWANMIVENATDGMPPGTKREKLSNEHRLKISQASKKLWDEKRDLIIDRQRATRTADQSARRAASVSASWTDERRAAHSQAIRGSHPKQPKGVKKTENHREAIRTALVGVPKVRCSRLHDRREMSVGEFTKWLNRLPSAGTCSK